MPTINGTDGDDTLNGTSDDDIIDGGAGDDTIHGDGNDLIHGGQGSNSLYGDDGNDTIYADGRYGLIEGGAGDDTIYAGPNGGHFIGGSGNDTIVGTSSLNDFVDYSDAVSGVIVSLAISGPQNTGNGLDTLIEIDMLQGSPFDDILTGGDLFSDIWGLQGNDQLIGGAGPDRLYGGPGDDSYIVNTDSDRVFEEADEGYDTIFSSVSFSLFDIFHPFRSSNIEAITLTGSANVDAVGDFGANVLTGNSGNNVLEGLGGGDILTGGAGTDTFAGIASGLDGATITDFQRGDRIVITDADPATFSYALSGNVLTYSGGSLSFGGHAPANLVVSAAAGGGVEIGIAQFGSPTSELAAFGYDQSAGGWVNSDRYPRAVGDVNGDGMADVIGMGEDGVFVSLATGGGHYGPATFVLAGFGASVAAGGWNYDDRYPRLVGDVNGDGRADIVGFGEDGGFAALGQADGTFGIPTYSLNGFGASTAAGGWNSQTKYTRMLGDVNGDGKADIVGFAEDGVFVALATGGGYFGTPTFTFAGFGASAAAGSWNSEEKYPRMLADVNNDGMADIIGFAEAGVFVSLATGGGHFGVSTFRLADFGTSTSGGAQWGFQDQTPRMMGDADGDGNADIIGLASDGVWISYGHGDGTFSASVHDINAFGSDSGWPSQDDYPRFLADTNHDGAADIIGLGGAGVYVSLSNGLL